MTARSRRRLLLALGLAAGLLALLVVALVISVNVLDADAFRPLVQRRLHEATARDVTFSRLELSALPLPVLIVHDLVVAAPQPGSEPWIEAKALRARVKLRPLLSGRLEVLGIALDRPTLRVLRAADGRLNIATLLGQKRADAARERVSFGALQVRDGRAIIADAHVHPGRVERIELTGLDVRVPDLSARPLVARVSGKVAPANGEFEFDGRLGPGNDLAGQVRLDALDLHAVSPWTEGLTGMADLAGTLTCDLELARSAEGAKARGKVSTKALVLPVALRGATPLDAVVDLDVTTDAAGAVNLGRFDLQTGATKLSLAGSVSSRDGKQVAEIRLGRTRLRPADLAQAAASLGIEWPSDALGGDTIDIVGKAQVIRSGEPRRVERILIDGLEISGAKLVIRRDASGRWLLPGGGVASPGSASRSASGASAAALGAFSARDVQLRDIDVLIDDRSPGGFGRVEASNVSLRLASYAAGKPGPFEFSAQLAGGSVEMKGQIAASGGDTALDVRVDGANLAQLAPLMGSLVAAMPTDGTLSWRSRVTGRIGQSLAVVGTATLADARMKLSDGREVVLDLPIEHDLRFEPGGRIVGKRLVLGLPGGKLPLTMQREPGNFAIATDGETTLSPESVRWLVALAGTKLPFGLETEDPVTLDARVAKVDGRLAMAGRMAMSRARITHALLPGPLDVARARILLEGDRIDVEDAALRLGGSALAGSFSVRDLDSPRLTFDLVAPEADLDELFAMTGRASDARVAGGGSGPSLAQRMRADGRLRVEHASFGGLQMSRFDASVALADGLLTFDPAMLALYDGTARATGRFDLRNDSVGFDIDLGLDGVDIGALMLAGMDYRDLAGRGNATLRLVGHAGTLDSTLRSLEGGGEMTLSDGVFRGLNALASLKKASVFGEQSLATMADRLAREGTPFSTLATRFSFSSAVMRIEALDMATPDADLTARGQANLLSQQIDMDLLVLFSKALSEQMRAEGSRAAEFFWDASKGRVSLPARLRGPLAEASAEIDYSKAAAQAAKGRLADLLAGALGGGRSPSGPPGPPEARLDGSGGGGVAGESGSADPGGDGTRPDVLSARIDSLKFGGSVLAPDLKIRATLSGLDLSHGTVTVTDDKGRVLATFNEAFAAQVTTYYLGAARDEPARIPVKLDVDGKGLLGAKEIVVRVQAVDASGALSPAVTSSMQRGGLF